MFDVFTSLTKAAIGVLVETPIALAADVVTLGGSLTDEDESYTASALGRVVRNVQDATDL